MANCLRYGIAIALELLTRISPARARGPAQLPPAANPRLWTPDFSGSGREAAPPRASRALARFAPTGETPAVQKPNLQNLKSGASAEWDLAFQWLWPSVVAVVNGKLGEGLAADVEDVALESVEALVEKVPTVRTVDELRLLALAIARNKAVDFLRRHLAAKRDVRHNCPLDVVEANAPDELALSAELQVAEVDARELAMLLQEVLELIEPRERQWLTDFFIQGLSYAQIAEKHGIAVGSVGVLLARARNKVQKLMTKNPQLLKEVGGFLR